MISTIKIDAEFKSLIPPLAKDELAQLEANIVKDGCREPLSLWGETLVDGHNRYEICTRNGIRFGVVQIPSIKTRDDAKLWIGRNQLGRRNLTDFQRVEVALMIKPIVEARATAARIEGNAVGGGKSSQNSDATSAPIRTDDTVADIAGVSRDTVRKVEAIKEAAAPEVVAAVRSGEISINLASQVAELPEEEQAVVAAAPVEQIKEVAREAVHNHRAQGTGENEWYTPEQYIEAAREMMGGIDVDPASSEIAQQTVKADAFFTINDDGLRQDWNGKVWLNPPYAQPAIQHFMQKAVDEYCAERMEEGIVLTHNYTDTAWFHIGARFAEAICFTRGRIGFLNPEGKKAAPTQGQAFFYFGKRPEDFADAFCQFGFVMVRP